MEIMLYIVAIVAQKLFEKRRKQCLHLMQLEEYKTDKFIEWISDNKSRAFFYSEILPSKKSPLVLTDRAKRLLNADGMLNLVISVFIAFLFHLSDCGIDQSFLLLIILLAVQYILQPMIMLISTKIMNPKEKEINFGFYIKAQSKIKNLKKNGLKVVGITGSYGKTSTKFIISTILKEKYNVMATPESYNTPMGISKVINNDLSEKEEVFIAEMGAYTNGEIKEVAELVSPDIGVITAIGLAHIETFKTIENTTKTKFELIDALPSDGIGVFNADNSYVFNEAEKRNIKKYYYGQKNRGNLDIYAEDIKVGIEGSTFKLVIKNVGEIVCKTKLLGEHNINNILAGAAVANAMGLSLEEIAEGISKINQIEHRLNIIDSGNGIIVIDDGFNSNPDGAKAALDVLGQFDTGKKVIVTPGMIGLGNLEKEKNKIFGSQIASVCDYAILVGEKRTKPIYEGIIEGGFDKEKIFVVNSLDDATKEFSKFVRPGDIILFENDLPDNYSEEE